MAGLAYCRRAPSAWSRRRRVPGTGPWHNAGSRLSTLPPDSTGVEVGGGIELLAYMLLLHGRVDEARVVLERPVGDEWADNPSVRSRYIGMLGVIAGMQGDRQRALKISQDLEAQPWTWRSSKRFWQARIAASLGEFDRATAILREAVAEGLTVTRIHFESSLLSLVLRDHPPFQELIRPKG